MGFLLSGFFTRRNFRGIVTLRLCQHLASGSGPLRAILPLLKVMHKISTHSASMDLPWKTSIGGGIAITHGWGLVVSPGAKIGNNVTIFHGATLGRADKISNDGHRMSGYPTIEDEVWIGPHAVIVGGITIGRGSRIAGGAFISSNIPAHSMVSENPAKIARTDCQPDIMNRAPI